MRSPETDALADLMPKDDLVMPFRIDGEDVRGRICRLGPAVDRVVSAHAYPEPVGTLLAELVALTALLGTTLKFDGMLTIQSRGSGPVSMLVADYHSGGRLRAYAEVNETKLSHYGRNPSFSALVGTGHLALTLDKGTTEDRYQGIVPLEGDSLADCATQYFLTSEQIPTRLKLSAAPTADGWRAAGLMVQYLPHGDEEEGAPRAATFGDRDLEAFQTAATLLDTARPMEMLDPGLEATGLLYRLYHEDGVRVFDPVMVGFGCRCSREKIGAVLARYAKEELADMADDGIISVDCQFCNTSYKFEI